MSRRGSRSSWQRYGARLLTVASFLTLPAIGVLGIDRRAGAAAAESADPCLGDALCRAHYKRARALSRDGEYQGALEAYQTAYRRRAASWLLLSIGRTLHKLGRPSEALGYYNQYKEKELHPAPELIAQHLTDPAREALATLRARFADMTWEKPALNTAIKETCTAHGLKMPQVAIPLRVAILGQPQTPSIDGVLETMGREQVLRRLDRVL